METLNNEAMPSQEKPKAKTNGKRNKTAGCTWEWESRDIVKDELGFKHVVTCRGESRSRDNEAIDLINKNEAINGRLPISIQCKNTSSPLNYHKIFAGYTKLVKVKRTGEVIKVKVPPMGRIPGIINAIWHKMTGKSEGGKFMEKGRYATTTLDDHITLMKAYLELKKYKEKYGELEQTIPGCTD